MPGAICRVPRKPPISIEIPPNHPYDFSEEETLRATFGKARRRYRGVLSPPRCAASVTTVIHEATHQIAFNRGLFLRTAYPLWAVEGLMLLEVLTRVPRRMAIPGARGVNTRVWPICAAPSKPIRPIRSVKFWKKNHQTRPLLRPLGLYYYLQTKNRKLARYLKVAVSKSPYAVWSPEDRVADWKPSSKRLEQIPQNFYKFILPRITIAGKGSPRWREIRPKSSGRNVGKRTECDARIPQEECVTRHIFSGETPSMPKKAEKAHTLKTAPRT